MNISAGRESFSAESLLNSLLPPALMLILLAAFAINGGSLWLDELLTWARWVNAPSLSDWLHQLRTVPDSDAQQPFYNFYIWLWGTIFPTSEYWLRLANLPWLALAFFLSWTAPASGNQRWFPKIFTTVVFIHPLTWYYANEIRSYALMLSASTLACAGLAAKLNFETGGNGEARANTYVILGVSLMAATTALGAIWALSFAIPAVLLSWRRHGWSLGLRRKHLRVIAVCAVLLLPVAWQYLTSFARGVTAAAQGHKLANFIFGFYEVFGLAGIGPGRFELRAAGSRFIQVLLPYFPYIALAALPIFSVMGIGLYAWAQRSRRQLLLVLIFALIPVGILYLFAVLREWRVVGRHMIALTPLFCLTISFGIQQLLENLKESRGLGIGRVLLAAFCIVALAWSSLSLAVADRHGREDYKRAAATARAAVAHGLRVWWATDRMGADFYGLDQDLETDCLKNTNSEKLIATVPSTVPLETLTQCRIPQLAILSIRDPVSSEKIIGFLKERNFRLAEEWIGFQVWHGSEP